MAAEAEENAEDKRGQGALAKVSAERKLRGPCRREEGGAAFDERRRKKRRGWMGTGKTVSRLSDVEIDGKTRNRETRTGPKGRCEKKKRTRGRKGKKGEGDEEEQSFRFSARCQIENRCLEARFDGLEATARLKTHPDTHSRAGGCVLRSQIVARYGQSDFRWKYSVRVKRTRMMTEWKPPTMLRQRFEMMQINPL